MTIHIHLCLLFLLCNYSLRFPDEAGYLLVDGACIVAFRFVWEVALGY